MPQRSPSSKEWTFPATKELFETTGLYPVQQYIEILCTAKLKIVAQRSIMELCLEAERKRRTGPRQYLWDQRMDLKGAMDPTATEDVKLDFEGD